jgi:hypothetical protein
MQESKDVTIAYLKSRVERAEAEVNYLRSRENHNQMNMLVEPDQDVKQLPESVNMMPIVSAYLMNDFDRGIAQVLHCKNIDGRGRTHTWQTYHSHFETVKRNEKMSLLLELNDRMIRQLSETFFDEK